MTETTETRHYIVDPVAFVFALIGAPILFTAATFWLMFVPVGALIVGGIPYLIIGVPVLLIHLRRNPADACDIAWTAFVSCTVVVILGTAVILLQSPPDPHGIIGLAVTIFVLGGIFSSCWGATFGWLYNTLARDFYTAA